MKPLYKISAELERITYQLEESDDPESVRDSLDTLTEERDQKLENIGKVIRTMEQEEGMLSLEEARLKIRRKSLEKRREWLEQYTVSCLGGKSHKTTLFSFQVRPSEAVVIDKDATVPEQYLREIVTHEPDKKKITADIKAGAELFFARLDRRLNLTVK